MRARAAIVLALAMALVVGVALVRREAMRSAGDGSVPVLEALGGSAAGFARATVPQPFRFPDDHGPHDRYRTEWWYYTGNLSTAAGRRFGYQLTFFRIGLVAQAEPRRSAWAAREAWMAHFALTDVAGGRFIAKSRLVRGSLDLAGAAARPFRVWLEDWSAEAVSDAPVPSMRLSAAEGDVAIALRLTSVKPPVLHGDRGLSRKGPAPGNASYYYSLTRIPTSGEVSLGDTRLPVVGTSWMDREWSTSALEAGQVGWDWFALQLDDGRELMFYRLRRADGATDPYSAGSLVARDGTSVSLGADDVRIEVLEWWPGSRAGARYPSRWRLTVSRASLTLEVTPRLADQEWTEPVRYWEGSVGARGVAGGRAIAGEGYVELVGYEAPRSARLLEKVPGSSRDLRR